MCNEKTEEVTISVILFLYWLLTKGRINNTYVNIIQFFIEGVRIALNALWGNKLRTFLTMVGVATGIFAITAILTMVNSMKYSVSENLSALGNTTMFVHNWPWKDNSEDWFKFFNRPKVSYSDYLKLKNNLKDVVGVAYQVSAMGQTVKAEGRSISSVAVLGVTPDYGVLNNTKIGLGRFFSDIESNSGSPVCVVGYNIANGLYPDKPDATGMFIRIAGKKMRIVGVLEKQGAGLFGGSIDDQLLIPYRFAAENFNLNRRSIDKLITIKAVSYDRLDFVESEVIGLVRANRGLKPTAEDNFSINKQEMIMKQIDTIFKYLEDGGKIITIFSLLIGGFSILNIMYISVKERTNEIGVQKALGATNGFILHQFLTESILTCVLGGLLGLVFLLLAVEAARYGVAQAGITLQIVVSMTDVFQAILLSVFIGLIAGIIPALMAATVDPVIAIRAK